MFPIRKFYFEQTLVSVRIRLRNHADTQPAKRCKRHKGFAIYLYESKFGMLKVREKDVSLRIWSSSSTAH